MKTVAGTSIISMSPMQFYVKMVASNREELRQAIQELKDQYLFIETIKWEDTYQIDVSNLVTVEIHVVLHEDTDYAQLCQLRADLNSWPAA